LFSPSGIFGAGRVVEVDVGIGVVDVEEEDEADD
jgi:hypothetical protein